MKVCGRGTTALVTAAVVLSGCSQAAASPSAEALPLRGEARDPEFTLVITSPQANWPAEEAIEVQAELTYSGPLQVATIFSAVGGVIGFSVVEVNGERTMDAVRDAACATYTISQGDPITTPYRKSGEINPGEPNEAFYRDFFADPLFRLPAGSWRVTAWAVLSVGDCGGRKVELQASLLITVR